MEMTVLVACFGLTAPQLPAQHIEAGYAIVGCAESVEVGQIVEQLVFQMTGERQIAIILPDSSVVMVATK
jgi:hypothetical protein